MNVKCWFLVRIDENTLKESTNCDIRHFSVFCCKSCKILGSIAKLKNSIIPKRLLANIVKIDFNMNIRPLSNIMFQGRGESCLLFISERLKSILDV